MPGGFQSEKSVQNSSLTTNVEQNEKFIVQLPTFGNLSCYKSDICHSKNYYSLGLKLKSENVWVGLRQFGNVVVACGQYEIFPVSVFLCSAAFKTLFANHAFFLLLFLV